MTIKVGDKLPSATFKIMGEDGPQAVTTEQVFSGKRVALFAVPGAFTPTCSARHLPGFKEHHGVLTAKGIDMIACTAVNDVFVLDAWAKSSDVDGKILMLSDGNADFASALGLEMDGSGFGMGKRSKRYSMVVNNGVVEKLNIEDPGKFEVSSAEYMLGGL